MQKARIFAENPIYTPLKAGNCRKTIKRVFLQFQTYRKEAEYYLTL